MSRGESTGKSFKTWFGGSLKRAYNVTRIHDFLSLNSVTSVIILFNRTADISDFLKHERIYSGGHKVGGLEVCFNSLFIQRSEQLQGREQT